MRIAAIPRKAFEVEQKFETDSVSTYVDVSTVVVVGRSVHVYCLRGRVSFSVYIKMLYILAVCLKGI